MKCLLFISMLILGCGQDRIIKEYVPVPAPPAGGGGSGGSSGGASYVQTQALMNTYCLSCHSTAQFMGSERALRASAVSGRVRSGSMPPANASRKLPDADRRKLLSFF